MRAISRIVLLLAMLLLSGEAIAQSASCIVCRQDAQDIYNRCTNAAVDAALRAACNATLADAARACALGACADDPPRLGACEDCRSQVAVEDARCAAMEGGSAGRAQCERGLTQLRSTCRFRICGEGGGK
jgi:hypothetical protein